MLRARSASTFDKPTRKKPSVTLTASPASGVPRACSLDFIRMPGTLPTPPPLKSGGRMKVNSAVWLAGSDESVLRRNDIVIFNLRSGMSMLARTAISAFWLPDALIGSVRQTTEPTNCLPLGSEGSSSYSTTRCATGATGWSDDDGWPTRSGIFGFDSGALFSFGASPTGEGGNKFAPPDQVVIGIGRIGIAPVLHARLEPVEFRRGRRHVGIGFPRGAVGLRRGADQIVGGRREVAG